MTPDTRRPLWRLLLSILKQKPDNDFTCDECFRMLEYLAYIRAQNAVSPMRLRILIKKHLAVCPECSEHYAQVLEQMESRLN